MVRKWARKKRDGEENHSIENLISSAELYLNDNKLMHVQFGFIEGTTEESQATPISYKSPIDLIKKLIKKYNSLANEESNSFEEKNLSEKVDFLDKKLDLIEAINEVALKITSTEEGKIQTLEQEGIDCQSLDNDFENTKNQLHILGALEKQESDKRQLELELERIKDLKFDYLLSKNNDPLDNVLDYIDDLLFENKQNQNMTDHLLSSLKDLHNFYVSGHYKENNSEFLKRGIKIQKFIMSRYEDNNIKQEALENIKLDEKKIDSLEDKQQRNIPSKTTESRTPEAFKLLQDKIKSETR